MTERAINILHLISSNSFLGAERVISELAKGSDPERSKVHVGVMVASQGILNAFVEAIDREDIPVTCFPCDGKFSVRGYKTIERYIVDNRIDLVHSHGYKADIYSLCLRRFSGRNIKLVSSCHTWKLRTIKEKYYKIIDLFVLKWFDFVVAISEEIKSDLLNSGIDWKKVKIIHNGVNPFAVANDDSSSIYGEIGVNRSDMVIGTVSSLTQEKAQHDLLKAFARLVHSHRDRGICCVLVGDGSQRAYLECLADELRIRERVVFTGYRNDARRLYRVFDLFALVSYAEGLPMAMLEAMAAGVPVVASRVGAIPGVIDNRTNGILIEPGDIDGIAEALCHLVEHPEIRMELGAMGKEKVISDHSQERMCRDYDEMYRSVMGAS